MKARSPWPFAVLGILGFVIALNLYLLHLARTTGSGSMETESPYAVSQEFQKDIDAQEALRRSGLQVGFRATPAGIDVAVLGKGSDEVARVSVRALRSQDSGEDFRGEIARGSKGFHADRRLRSGVWFVAIEFIFRGKRMLWKETQLAS